MLGCSRTYSKLFLALSQLLFHALGIPKTLAANIKKRTERGYRQKMRGCKGALKIKIKISIKTLRLGHIFVVKE